MKIIPRRKHHFINLLVFIIILLSSNVYSQQEIIINGNLSNYGNYANFAYSGGGYTLLTAPFSGTSAPGQNGLCINTQEFNASFIFGKDHTTTFSEMLVVDGSTNLMNNGRYFWKGGYNGQGFCGLTAGNVYTFSYWVKSVSALVTNPATQADIKIDFSNAADITLISGTSMAPLPALGWQKVIYTFKATGSCVNINLWDSNLNATGNDFAVDDFSLLQNPPSLSITYSLSDGNCDTELFPYKNGGNIQYDLFTLTGPSYSKSGGNFNNLLPGNYVLTLTEQDGTSIATDVVVPQPKGTQLTISPDVTICSGDQTTLEVSGSTAPYYWDSKPYPSGMSGNTGSSITVSPTVTTTYTANSYETNAANNLIYNGDFSMGTTGFGSYHTYYPTNLQNAAGAYGVVSDPSTWGTGFPSCGDHTTGSGNMLVVNATDHLSAGVGTAFWQQAVSVLGTTDYTFSFWVQSLSGNFPGKIHVSINGTIYNVYPFVAPNTDACGNWVKYSINYFSGWTSNVAYIELLSSNVSFFGNDFAIDDISFTTATSCASKKVTVTVDQPQSVVVSHDSTTGDQVTFDWNALPEATGYTISYSVNDVTPVDAGSITANAFTVNGLNPGDKVKIEVKPIGTGCFAATDYTGHSFTPCVIPLANVSQQPSCTNPLGSITVTEPLGAEYQYSLDGTTFGSNPVFNNLAFGNYNVIANNTLTGCEATSLSLSLNEPGLILPDINASSNYQNCSITLVASSTVVNSSIVWNGPNLTINTANPAVTNTTGKYTATVKDLLTGCTNSFSLDVTAPVKPSQPSVIKTQLTCITATGSIEITAPLGNNYKYSIDGTHYQPEVIFQNLNASTYFVTVKDITTECVSEIEKTDLIPETIEAPVPVANDINLCRNSFVSALSVTALPGAIVNWYDKNATGGTASQDATVPDTSVLGTTTYYCSQTIGLCESPRTAIRVNVSDTALIPDFKDLKYCYGSNDIPVLSTISPNGIKGTWQPETISNTVNGAYVFTPDVNECATAKTITVTINSPIDIKFNWAVEEAFAENQVLKITPASTGDFLYQLDFGTPQISPVFENITHGSHSVTVIDSNGCSPSVIKNDIIVIDYPKFFSPNNDGFNDSWTIPELFDDPTASVQIFDRYGKLLKVLNLKNSDVWDGLYNRIPMPSSDYWFVVHYSMANVPKIFKAHFSLKR